MRCSDRLVQNRLAAVHFAPNQARVVCDLQCPAARGHRAFELTGGDGDRGERRGQLVRGPRRQRRRRDEPLVPGRDDPHRFELAFPPRQGIRGLSHEVGDELGGRGERHPHREDVRGEVVQAVMSGHYLARVPAAATIKGARWSSVRSRPGSATSVNTTAVSMAAVVHLSLTSQARVASGVAPRYHAGDADTLSRVISPRLVYR